MNEIRIPLDFEGWPEYRNLARLLAGTGIDPLAVWLRLWVELGQQAPATGRLGALPAEAVPLFEASLPVGTKAVDLIEVLETVKLLRADGEGYSCPRFASANPQLASGYKALHQRGADMSRFVRAQRKINGGALGQALLIPTELFRTPAGEALDPETVRRVTILINTADNALMKPAREPHQFTEGLIQNAWQVLQDYSDDQIDRVFRSVVGKRGHAAIPTTADKLLQEFRSVAEGLL
jgi:hypothetical protein